MIKLVSWLATVLAAANIALAGQAQKTEEDSRREAAMADFTRQMREANYPALFEQAAQAFNVPADVLKGIAFAETRWEHLRWPPGETASPETGMPRPYGIMSLWDNRYFGHSLLEAAKLIGKDPEELKDDPRQNIRVAAALLRKIYDENAKPDGTTEADIESWRYAIRKYCGIPEPDLNAQHALKVYRFMSQGYHQYGIEWNGRPVKLGPMEQETTRIIAEEKAKRELGAVIANSDSASAVALAAKGRTGSTVGSQVEEKAQVLGTSTSAVKERAKDYGVWVAMAIAAGLLVAAGYWLNHKRTKR